ncbi:hypothetical protein ABZS71_21740 [Streptomyces sp. NPDC005393]
MTDTIGLLHPGSMGSAFGAQLPSAATSWVFKVERCGGVHGLGGW